MSVFLWVIFPYLCLAIFVVGHFWRYRYDKFGWTTRSSQLYESRLLRWGSPLFHFGMLGVVGGHILGLLLPKSWTDAVGISETLYHWVAMVGGLLAGIATIAGLVILIYRRRTVGPVFSSTTPMDKTMYFFLGLVILLGMWNTVASGVFGLGSTGAEHFNYRDNVSLWYRGIFSLNPDPNYMVGIPIGFQLHAFFASILFALWPFTRLVHVFSAPVGYITRPYIVYRSSDARAGAAVGTQAPKRGWERVQ